MRATSSTLADNVVQIHIEVDEPEVVQAVDETAKRFAAGVTVKGFRKGKAPRPVIEAHIGGKAALRSEAIRDALPTYFARAISETLVDPIGQPNFNIVAGEEDGALEIDVTVGVRPEVELVGYRNLQATIPSPIVRDDEIDARLDRIRETDAELNDVDRPVRKGDLIVADVATADPSGDHEPTSVADLTYRVGSEELGLGIDEMLIDHVAGDVVQAAARVAKGDFRTFEIKITQVRERILPELTDEWVLENTEFPTATELTDAVREQVRRVKVMQARLVQRDAMMSSLAELVDPEVVPATLVSEEMSSRVDDLEQRLRQRGLSFEFFLETAQTSQEELMTQIRDDAEKAVRVDLALRALARQESLGATDADIDQEVTDTAAAMKVDETLLREKLVEGGRLVSFIAEITKMKATKWLVEHVTYFDEDGTEIDRSIFEADESEPLDA